MRWGKRNLIKLKLPPSTGWTYSFLTKKWIEYYKNQFNHYEYNSGI